MPLFEELPLPYSHFYQSAKNVALAKHIGQEQQPVFSFLKSKKLQIESCSGVIFSNILMKRFQAPARSFYNSLCRSVYRSVHKMSQKCYEYFKSSATNTKPNRGLSKQFIHPPTHLTPNHPPTHPPIHLIGQVCRS